LKVTKDYLLEICDYAVKIAINKGAEDAEAFGVSSLETEASIERNDITLGKFHRESGIGIRILKNKCLGFSSINILGKEEISQAVESAVKIANLGSPDKYNKLPSPSNIKKISDIFDSRANTFEPEDALKKSVELLQIARSYDKRVTVDSGAFNSAIADKVIANSNGIECEESASIFSWFIMGMAIDGADVSSFDFQFDGNHNIDQINVENTSVQFAENVVNSLGAKRCEAFKGSLILNPQAVVELIIPSLVSSVNSNNVQKGRSQFIGKLGQEVTSKELSVTDDATWSEGLAASSFDREGVPHKPLKIIEDGILKSFLYNTYTGFKEGVDSTGHATGSEESSPHVGDTNVIFNEGDVSFENMLNEVRRGILVTRFSGNVNPVSGDYSGVVKGGHLIVGGEKKHSLKETLIAGNIFDLLLNISGISRERDKVFNYLLPYLRVEDISITSG
jgi:PmbA protein